MLNSPEYIVILCASAIFAIVGVVVGIRRSRRAGRIDPFHPLVFPVAYVAVATLTPALWLWLGGDLGYIVRERLSTRTPLLLGLATVGFVLGAGAPLAAKVRREVPLDSNTMTHIGRLVLLVPLALAGRDLANSIVLTRGLGQDIYSLTDSVSAAGYILAPAAVALLVIGQAGAGKPLGNIDWILIGTLIGILGLNGRRAASVAVMVVVLVYLTRRGASTIRLVAGLTGVVAFVYAVVTYRTNRISEETTLSAVPVLLRDLGSVAFTTGITDRVTGDQPFGGSTLVASIVRQLPSPIAIHLLGEPNDTGSAKFRTLSGLNDANAGYGFSIPAEGVMNFGIVGAFLLPFLLGLALAWLYRRFRLNGTHASQWAYMIAVGTLPFAWRSDTLGLIKGVLYPVILFWLATITARTMRSYARQVRPILKPRPEPSDACNTRRRLGP